MKEYTLQGAIELCKKNGGRFYSKEYKGMDKDWGIDTGGNVRNIQNSQIFELSILAFETVWIYEPPKQSAFQKWSNLNIPDLREHTKELHRIIGRKEGWNAAIDAVLGCVQWYDGALVGLIKELKEE